METRMLKGYFEKQADESFSIMASTNDIDRMDEIVEPSAFTNLKEYLNKNPVILFGHNYDKPPVGKAVNGEVVENGLRLDIQFAETDFAREIRYLYENGFMSAFSIGFIPKAWERDKEERLVHTEVELLEVSAVPVPANQNALLVRALHDAGFRAEVLAPGDETEYIEEEDIRDEVDDSAPEAKGEKTRELSTASKIKRYFGRGL